MTALPGTITPETIADGADITAAPHRNNYAAIQTAVNALIASLSGGAAGQVLQAAGGSSVGWGGGTYVAYTPTLSSSGGGSPTLGNATVVARWTQIGKMVHAYGQIVFGSTTSLGTGTAYAALPAACATDGVMLGSAVGYHNSGGLQAMLSVRDGNSAGNMALYGQATFNGALAAVSGSGAFPWTWAAGDNLIWNLLYEAS